MPNVNDLKRSKFLTQKDVARPILVTVAAYKEVNVAMEGAEPDEKWVLYFKEFDKPLVLNSTNGQLITAIVGSGEFEDWIGHKIVLYVDPNVSYGGQLKGGIRCRAPKGQTIPAPTPATFDRNKSIENLRNAQKAAGMDNRAINDTLAEAKRLQEEADAAAAELAEPVADDEV